MALPTEPGEYVEVVRKIAISTQYSTLITQNAQNEVHARLMQHFDPEDDMTLWYGTHRQSRKALDMRENSRVSVMIHDDYRRAYAVLEGEAEVVEADEDRRNHWFADWYNFWDGGPEDPDFVVIRVRPTRIEILSFQEEIAPDPYGLAHADMVLVDGAWQFEE